jgi:hypothetical protein
VHRRAERIVPAGCVWLAVAALHALLLWAWHSATQPLRPPPQAVTATVLLRTVEPLHRQDTGSATATKKPAHRIERAPPRPRSERGARRPGSDRAAGSAEHTPLPPSATGVPGADLPAPQAPAAEAPLSEAPAAPPAPAADTLPLLDRPATRDAIRALARQQPLTEAAQLASSASAPRPGERLGQAIKQAGKGHCAQGEYFGSGMGVLSLPFLVAALARDDCAQ